MWCQTRKIETVEEKPKELVTKRVKIDLDTVRVALAAAAANAPGRQRWVDTEEKRLLLERRADRVAWFAKNRNVTRKLGDVTKASYKAEGQLTPSEARKAAQTVFVELAGEPALESVAVWTWAECVKERLAVLKGKRLVNRKIKLPSAETQNDVRSVFGIDRKTGAFVAKKRPSLAAFQNTKLTEIYTPAFVAAMCGIKGIRPREKFLTYAKAMLSWAYSSPQNSGFAITAPWWPEIEPPAPAVAEVESMEADEVKLTARKLNFRVQQVGDFLMRHEAFCAGKISNEKISPGIRWAIWWICLTANRRGSTSQLERANVQQQDPFGEKGWGTALWTPVQMKAKKLFMVPVPPIGLHAINCSIADWHELVKHSHTAAHKTGWAFASTRRVQRTGVGLDRPTDIAIHPSSLADHLANMYGRKPKKNDPNPKNHLKGIDFSLHIVRDAATHFLENCPGLPPAASSAFLGHLPPTDDKDPEARSPTTEKFYSKTQRMPQKILAMRAWSEAVMEAYEKAGGKWPQPYPPPNGKIIRIRK
jgi:hypothetical protein